MRKSKYISGGGETLKTVSTIDNGMRAKIPANSELEGTIMQLHPGIWGCFIGEVEGVKLLKLIKVYNS